MDGLAPKFVSLFLVFRQHLVLKEGHDRLHPKRGTFNPHRLLSLGYERLFKGTDRYYIE